MTQTSATPPYTLTPGDKVAQVMIYTLTNLFWGEVVVKDMVRVSIWLRTNSAPNRITLYNARAMNVTSSVPSKPLSFPNLSIPVSQLMGFHLLPPAQDPLDYDPTEPNRKMEPVSVVVGSFRIDGSLRLSAISSLSNYLEVTHEAFTAVYDAKISNLLLTSFGVISVPFLLVRQETAIFMRA